MINFKRLFFLFLSWVSSFGILLGASLNPDFQANYAEALQKAIYFFDVQRSGKLPADYRVPWRSHSALGDAQAIDMDGNFVDLEGGFYDAGDNIKYGYPFAFTTTILAWSLHTFHEGYSSSGQLDDALDNLKWAADYLLKCWQPEKQRFYAQVGNTRQDHDFYYVPCEILDLIHTQRNEFPRPAYYIDPHYPGSDLAGSSAAALAACSIVFKENGDFEYAQKLLTSAQQLYEFGCHHLGFYTESVAAQGDAGVLDAYNSFKGGSKEDKHFHEVKYLGLAAAWLAQATSNPKYLDDATRYLPCDPHLLHGDSSNWSDNTAGAYLILATLLPSEEAQRYELAINNWFKLWKKMPKTPQGLAYYSDWGGNLSYISNMCFHALVYSAWIEEKNLGLAEDIRQFVISQINYILGDNKARKSYMVGYGVDWPKHLHHATAQGGWSGISDLNNTSPDKHILFGALVGGPGKKDNFNDDRNDYRSTETAIDYCAGLQGTLAGLQQIFPGVPLSDFSHQYQTAPNALDEYLVKTSLNTSYSSSQNITIGTAKIHVFNHSFWPATILERPTLHVFLNLSELSPRDVIITINEQNVPLIPYDEERKIYYFQVLNPYPLYPGGNHSIGVFPNPSTRDFTINIKIPGRHYFENDWSFKNASGSSQANPNICFYKQVENGSLVKMSGFAP